MNSSIGKILFVDQQTKMTAALSFKSDIHVVGGVRKEGVISANNKQFIIEETALIFPTKRSGIEHKCVKIDTVLRFLEHERNIVIVLAVRRNAANNGSRTPRARTGQTERKLRSLWNRPRRGGFMTVHLPPKEGWCGFFDLVV